jgi:hypothetical protein
MDLEILIRSAVIGVGGTYVGFWGLYGAYRLLKFCLQTFVEWWRDEYVDWG